jgi:hypothetical protein
MIGPNNYLHILLKANKQKLLSVVQTRHPSLRKFMDVNYNIRELIKSE